MVQELFDEIVSIPDYQLRIARINSARAQLDRLEKEAEEIKALDLPLWYCEVGREYDGGQWRDLGGLMLVREDLDAENLAWAKSHCANGSAYDSDFRRELDPESKVILRYTGPYAMVAIGNKTTPPKWYYKGYLKKYNGYDVRALIKEFKQRLGPNTWSERPLDITGNKYY